MWTSGPCHRPGLPPNSHAILTAPSLRVDRCIPMIRGWSRTGRRSSFINILFGEGYGARSKMSAEQHSSSRSSERRKTGQRRRCTDSVVGLFLSEDSRNAAGRVAASFPPVKDLVKIRTSPSMTRWRNNILSKFRQVVILGAGLDTRAVKTARRRDLLRDR